MIDDRHIAFLKGQDEVRSDDVFGDGELLFARNLPTRIFNCCRASMT